MDDLMQAPRFEQTWRKTLLPTGVSGTPRDILMERLARDHDLEEGDLDDISLALVVVDLAERRLPAPQWLELSRHESEDGQQMFVAVALPISTAPLVDGQPVRLAGAITFGSTLRQALTQLRDRLSRPD